ncbi:MAG TPA: thioredoxin domain-containing protein [Gemmataceae bacterium]|jgi:thiol-disulfide isomerase/thioredoxin|nr:thioredoxin domain-containing protein [Gemmataceae bacterium]
MNTLPFTCPHCNCVVQLPAEVQGQSVKCAECQAEFQAVAAAAEEVIPEASAVVPPPLPPRRAEPSRVEPRRRPSRYDEPDELPRPRKQGGSALPILFAVGAIGILAVFAGVVVIGYKLLNRPSEPAANDRASQRVASAPQREYEPPPRPIRKEEPKRAKDPDDIAAEIVAVRAVMLKTGTSIDYVVEHGPNRLDAWRQAAERGAPGAQWLVGRSLQEGIGGDANVEEAVKWYRKSAEQGFDLGQNSLGLAYSEGEGVEEDEIEAMKWLTKAAEQGLPTAMCNLGDEYGKKDTDRDDRKAFQWYKRAADLNSRTGQFSVAEAYEEGKGVDEDMGAAARWYLKASDQGHTDATVRLVVLYEEGHGIDKNPGEAKRLRERAKEQLGENAEKEIETYAFTKYPVGRPALPTEGTIDGKPFKLSDFKGKVVVLKFGATWCGPCKAMIPHRKKMVKRLANEPFAYLEVDIDENEELSNRWHVGAVPVVYVIDPAGIIRDHEVYDEELDEAVDKLLKEMKDKK